MNNVSFNELENQKVELLKKYQLDTNSIKEFRSKIKQVSQEESDALGKELFEMIFKKDFNDDYEKALDLIYKGANVEYKNKTKGNFALIICARKDYFKTFLLLLRAGANVNQVNNFLTTSAMASARHGNSDILEILILMDADINARCLDGDTAIMSAKRHTRVGCFYRLEQAHAYLNNRNLYNQTIEDLHGVYSDLGDNTSDSGLWVPEEQDPFALIEEAEQKLKKLK